MEKQMVAYIIEQLKAIDVDGETMQHIIESVGMESQMLRQLVMQANDRDINELVQEKSLLK